MMFKWVKNTKLHGFIEAYHAPYKPKYRYWTGLLLLLRILLNILITVNISGSPRYNLLTTGITITLLKTYIGNKVYKIKTLDYTENICYFNLLFLTIATFYTQQINAQKTSTYASIGVTLVLFLCISIYHVHCAFSNFMWYRKVFNWTSNRVKRKTLNINDTSDPTRVNKLIK